MKKFTLILSLLAIVFEVSAQDFGGAYPNCTDPAGYTFSQGARITAYANPIKGCAGGDNDCGIITPGVGGNNPANVIFPPTNVDASTTTLTKCFGIFVLASNLKCETNKAFPCDTYVTAYIVEASYNSTSAPSPSEYYGISERKLVQAFGFENCVSVSFNRTHDLSKQYRVFLDFTNDGTCNQNNTKYIIDILPAGGPLPIRLLSFNGAKETNKVQLRWQTSSEQDARNFDVEFSENASEWNSIGKVNATGNSTTLRNYSFIHNSPVNGVNFYRLKLTDINGYVSYSKIIPMSFAIKGVTINSLYPNPFVSRLKIDISSDRNDAVRIQLSDNSGRVLKVQHSVLQKGVNGIWLENLAGLTPGIYNVEVKTGYTTYRYKLKK